MSASIDYPGPADECAGGCGADMSTEACPNARDLCLECCGEAHGHDATVAWQGGRGYVATCPCGWQPATGRTSREDAQRLADQHNGGTS